MGHHYRGSRAGIPSAIAAVEQGADVLVVEEADRIGGTLHISGGHMSGGGTQRQKRRGISDSPERHFADIMRISRSRADSSLTRLACEEAPHTLDWLDELGFPFLEETPKIIYGHEAYQTPRTVWGEKGGEAILNTLVPLWDAALQTGRLAFRLEHRMTDLMLEKGRVSGIATRNNSNEENKFFGRHVVLTTGGYGSNPAFFSRVTPGTPRLVSSAAPTSSGEGIAAAQQIGGRFYRGEDYLPSLGGLELEHGSGRVDYNGAWAAVSTAVYRPPREIYVNAMGKRFMAEDDPSAQRRELIVLEQPGHQFWVIFDETALDDGTGLIPAWSSDDVRAEAGRGQCAWSADSITGLAHKIGVPAGRLETTVQEFNQIVEGGTEDKFGRTYLENAVQEPPFYAVLTSASSLITFGGLAVNTDLQVLNQSGEPIPGLYAAGEALGAGVFNGQAFCTGMLVTPALSFGRRLGRKLGRL